MEMNFYNKIKNIDYKNKNNSLQQKKYFEVQKNCECKRCKFCCNCFNHQNFKEEDFFTINLENKENKIVCCSYKNKNCSIF